MKANVNSENVYIDREATEEIIHISGGDRGYNIYEHLCELSKGDLSLEERKAKASEIHAHLTGASLRVESIQHNVFGDDGKRRAHLDEFGYAGKDFLKKGGVSEELAEEVGASLNHYHLREDFSLFDIGLFSPDKSTSKLFLGFVNNKVLQELKEGNAEHLSDLVIIVVADCSSKGFLGQIVVWGVTKIGTVDLEDRPNCVCCISTNSNVYDLDDVKPGFNIFVSDPSNKCSHVLVNPAGPDGGFRFDDDWSPHPRDNSTTSSP